MPAERARKHMGRAGVGSEVVAQVLGLVSLLTLTLTLTLTLAVTLTLTLTLTRCPRYS